MQDQVSTALSGVILFQGAVVKKCVDQKLYFMK